MISPDLWLCELWPPVSGSVSPQASVTRFLCWLIYLLGVQPVHCLLSASISLFLFLYTPVCLSWTHQTLLRVADCHMWHGGIYSGTIWTRDDRLVPQQPTVCADRQEQTDADCWCCALLLFLSLLPVLLLLPSTRLLLLSHCCHVVIKLSRNTLWRKVFTTSVPAFTYNIIQHKIWLLQLYFPACTLLL